MAKTRLFVIRHGRTMFNTIGRAQGWSDTPLTAEGERGIQALGIGLRESGLEFTRAYSSDSGRAIQTMGIILDELGLKDQIPYRFDKRIREWCFG
ncbi:phosphoglycerate mutase family protein, partial [Streptococcus sp. HMSC074F05]